MDANQSIKAKGNVHHRFLRTPTLSKKDGERKGRVRSGKTEMIAKNIDVRGHTIIVKMIATVTGGGAGERSHMTIVKMPGNGDNPVDVHTGAVRATKTKTGVGTRVVIQVTVSVLRARRMKMRASGWRRRSSHSSQKRNTQVLHRRPFPRHRGTTPIRLRAARRKMKMRMRMMKLARSQL